MLERAVRELRQEDHEFWASLSYGDLWSCHKTEVFKVKQQTYVVSIFWSIRCYHNDELWGDFLYRKITQRFIIHGLMNIWDRRGFNGTRLKKKVYPNLGYHINVIIWVTKFLDFSLTTPNFWVMDDHFTTSSYLSHYCLDPVKTITAFNKLGNTSNHFRIRTMYCCRMWSCKQS